MNCFAAHKLVAYSIGCGRKRLAASELAPRVRAIILTFELYHSTSLHEQSIQSTVGHNATHKFEPGPNSGEGSGRTISRLSMCEIEVKLALLARPKKALNCFGFGWIRFAWLASKQIKSDQIDSNWNLNHFATTIEHVSVVPNSRGRHWPGSLLRSLQVCISISEAR